MKKIAVLISGGGTNLRNLASKCQTDLKGKCEIVLVVSNVSGVLGLEIAKEFGLKALVLEDKARKISIHKNNVVDYNAFAELKTEAEEAFNEINKYLKEVGFEYSLLKLLENCLESISAISNFPEEDVKEDVLADLFFEAFTKDRAEISEEEEEELLSKIDDILYHLIEEIKVISLLFENVKKQPAFLKFFAREEYEKELHDALAKEGVECIFLAGFMRILSPFFVQKWSGKIFNIHPSLLPSFGGAKAVEEALEYGVKLTGCTVHYVDFGVDSGQIIAQKAVEVLPNDTKETLHERIKLAEKELYPKVLENLINGKL